MNKKGFTLIELLAVILVLGIIALIAIPTVNKVIEQSKKGAFERTIENIVKVVEEECQKDMLLGNTTAKTYTFTDGVATPTINVKGKLPKSGIITVDNECNASTNNLTDGKYVATKSPASNDLVITQTGGKICHVTSGDGTQIGDEITCGTESFYVYDTTGDTIKMLSKYNLKVGSTYNYNTEDYTPYSELEAGYNMQDANMRGYLEDQDTWKGITAFSNLNNNYSGSIVEEYVDNYKEILIGMGVTVQDARLISKEELVALGCNEDENWCGSKYEVAAPEWVYSTTYWSGSARGNFYVWFVTSGGSFDINDYFYDGDTGVRPVITILESSL